MMTLVVVTDGRDCIYDTIESAEEHLAGPINDALITRRLIYDDTGDPEHRAEMRGDFPDFDLIYHPAGRRGFGGAIRFVWEYLAGYDRNRWLFWLEDDFIFNRHVELVRMMCVMLEQPNLAQLVLRRQAWNEDERAAGGIVEQHPDDYADCHDGVHDWLEHRRFWSTNPHLCRMAITALGWPNDPHSEGMFTQQLLENPDTRFGFWGARTDDPWVEHVGAQRVGTGY